MNAIITSTVVGVAVPSIFGFVFYSLFMKKFGGLMGQYGMTNYAKGMFAWMVILSIISIVNLVFVSFLISYYRTVDES